MKIKVKKRLLDTKKIIAIVMLLVLVLALTILYLFLQHKLNINNSSSQKSSTSPVVNLDKPTTEQKAAGEDTKLNSNNNNDETNTTPSSTDNQKRLVAVTIPAANVNSSVLQIRSQINTVDSTGICSLTLTGPESKVITKTSEVQALASTSTCKGFDVPVSELSTGSWQVDLTFNNSSLTGMASKTITIE